MQIPAASFERFTRKILTGASIDDCWLWSGFRHPDGYGRVTVMQKRLQAHRVAYEAFVGPIPDGLLVCHRCDNPPCVNPAHLFLGTVQDNLADMHGKGRASGNKSKGSANSFAKFSEADVRAIRLRISAGDRQADIARSYHVTPTAIRCIAKGRTWGHLN